MMSSTASLPAPAKMRLTRELSLFSKSPPPGISCYTPNDTLTHLHAQIAGKNLFDLDCFGDWLLNRIDLIICHNVSFGWV